MDLNKAMARAMDSSTDETIANETIANETIANETIANETIANETIAHETIANETIADETIADETIADETSRIAYLGLGSNLGDRRWYLQQALWLLQGEGLELLRVSSVYESTPVGPVAGQPMFYNAVVQVETALEPLELLRRCQRVETALGRVRLVAKGPRVIDVDLLLMDDLVLEEPELTLPHSELRNRAFVLAPLAELAPMLLDPRDQTLLSCELGTVLRDQSLMKADCCLLLNGAGISVPVLEMEHRRRRMAT
jgi:2-amino-4-hydroxy-6-hydroxymethyldihydropteridine diphosphokinase